MKLLFFLLALSGSMEALSQKESVTYYDHNWFLTTRDRAEFYRIGLVDTVKYQFYGLVTDYYKNGKLQMKGEYHANLKVDTFYFYSPRGALVTKGFYKNNIRSGIWTNYYENGKVKDKVIFEGDFVAALEYYDKRGEVKMKNGTGEWTTGYQNENGSEIVKGTYKDLLRNGAWRFTAVDASGHKWYDVTETYKMGKFIMGVEHFSNMTIISKTSEHNIIPESPKFNKVENWRFEQPVYRETYPYLKFLPSADSILTDVSPEYILVDKSPEFPGGMSTFMDYLQKNLVCPTARNTDHLIFHFVVNGDGSVRRGSVQFPNKMTTFVNMTTESCKDSLVSIVEKSSKWIPAHMNNINSDVPARVVITMSLAK